MTALFSLRRRADAFAAAVDRAAGHQTPTSQGQPQPQGQHRDGDLDQELRRLVGVATALRVHPESVPDAAPSADFAADLRSRLMVEAEHVLTSDNAQLRLPARKGGKRERRIAVAAAAAVFVGGTAGMAAAAQQALPGETLYPIKRGIERAEAGLSVSPAGKGRDLLQQADDRLSEVEGLLAADSVTADPQVPLTVQSFTSQAEEGAGLLMADYEETRDGQDIVEVRQFTSAGIDQLRDLARTVPPDAQDELAAAATTLSEIDAEAVALCASCAAEIPPLEVPGIFLAATEVNRALAKLNASDLDNSHPVAVDRGLVKQADDAAGDKDNKTEADDPVATPAPSTSAAPDDQPGLGLTLPGGTDVSKGGKGLGLGSGKKKDNGSSGPVRELTDGLSGVVETLLPDPLDDGPGLP